MKLFSQCPVCNPEGDDTVTLVTCCMCNQCVPEDEAIEFEGNYYCNNDAEWGSVVRCAWCGEGGDVMTMIVCDGDECHEECVKEMKERKVESKHDLIMERAKLEAQREDAGEEQREIARANMEELLKDEGKEKP